MSVQTQELRLQGEPICRGVAIGAPLFFTLKDELIPEVSIQKQDIDREVQRYIRALTRSRNDVKKLKKKLLNEKIDEGAEILEAHLEMLHDPLLTNQVEKAIRRKCKNAESVFQTMIDQYLKKFKTIADPFFRDRMKDIQDIKRRIISHLRNSAQVSLAEIPSGSVVFSGDLTASDTAEANTEAVSAFVTERGGATSHAAIVAKAKGIPYVTNVNLEQLDLSKVKQVIVDGRTGEVIVNPSLETEKRYQTMQKQLVSHMEKLKTQASFPVETYDGYKILLSANVDMEHELEMLHRHGGCGVGLFRSEHIFLKNECFPTEEEQYKIYRSLVSKMKGLPIVIRTFDIGGDKFLNHQQTPLEGNPFLGCRAIRLLLREQDHFKAQLRAILRVSLEGDVSIMFPMISSLSELIESKRILKKAYDELKEEGVPLKKEIRVGCMVEVPSAAVVADLLAKECDFLSIGTNDLVQYSLAVDRTNHAVNGLYSSTDPSVIRLIKLVVTEANRHSIPVTVCGEIAADPRFTTLLLGLGVHELSVASRYIPTIRHAVRSTSIIEASHLAEEVLKLMHASEIEELITTAYRENVPEDCFYNI